MDPISMCKSVKEAIEYLETQVKALDPEVCEPAYALDLFRAFAKGERLCLAGRNLMTPRAVASEAWRKTGNRSAAHWLAKNTGTSVGNAGHDLHTAKYIQEHPATEAALRSGELSGSQVREIASAASANPSAEKDLLETAQKQGMTALREKASRVRAASLPNELARNRAIHRSRYLRHWTDREGAFRLEGRFTPQAGAIVLAGLEPLCRQLFMQARKEGRRESFEAYKADALVQMAEHARGCTAEGKRMFPSAMVNIRIDHSALMRGKLGSGEVCEIPGIGPIPVDIAKEFAQDSFLSAVLVDGDDIKSVKTFGRHIPAPLRTAVLERDQTCVVPSCYQRQHLEIDHILPIENNGPTQLDNLARLCRHHHYLKTHRGYRLSGGPGAWGFEPPPRPGTGKRETGKPELESGDRNRRINGRPGTENPKRETGVDQLISNLRPGINPPKGLDRF